MRAVLRGVTLGLLVPTVAAIAGACSLTVPNPQPVEPVSHRPALGDADRALAQFDPTELIKQLKEGQTCRGEGGGSSGTDDTLHRDWVLTCPRVGDDRTIYFLVADAIEAELNQIATVPGSGAKLGDVPNPLSNVWDIRGNAYLGSMRALGVNGNGSISIFVSLDLIVPPTPP